MSLVFQCQLFSRFPVLVPAKLKKVSKVEQQSKGATPAHTELFTKRELAGVIEE